MSVDLQTYRDIEKATECVICRDTFGRDEEGVGHTASKADHVFHTQCLQPWWKSNGNCPTCRQELADPEDRFGGREVQRVEEESEQGAGMGVVLVDPREDVLETWRVSSDPAIREALSTRIQHQIQSRGIRVNTDPNRVNYYDGMNILNARDGSIPQRWLASGSDELDQEDIQGCYDMYEVLKRWNDDDPESLDEGLFQENFDFLHSVFEPLRLHERNGLVARFTDFSRRVSYFVSQHKALLFAGLVIGAAAQAASYMS